MKKTIENLAKAFVGESQARNRYTIYAKIAKKEGYEQISAIFLETAEHEREHAKWLFKLINELKKTHSTALQSDSGQGSGQDPDEDYSEIKIEAGAPTAMGTTAENLKAAIAGENHENTVMYPDFANIAQEEGLTEIAVRLRMIGSAEKHHEERYSKLLAELEKNTIFKKEEKKEWTCRKCGYVHKGTTPPEKCPACDHPQAYYQLKCEKY